jgi:hypothetical protein
MKIFRKILFLAIVGTILPNNNFAKLPEPTRYPNDYLYTVHQDPWKFFEQIFITEPSMQLGNKNINIHRFIVGILAISPGLGLFFYKAFPGIKKYASDVFEKGYNAMFTSVSKTFVLHCVLSIAAIIILFMFFDRMIISSHRNKILFENFRNLILTSPNNKKLIPIEYQELVRHIYNEYTKSASNTELRSYAKQTIPKIVYRIYEQFPVKYRDKLETKKSLDSWIKWSLIVLAATATLKLLTSAAKDGFDISERLKNVNFFQQNQPVEPETTNNKIDDGSDELLNTYRKFNS